ncbi:unnamed protein product [Lepeophtheirus salmonis]|uniref:(salmon louse) hypothetical protein n=1 Tax=Lepeophtheirus salmonis TaxID=72036 RepID=A0A7R8D6T7_LEPSM|nr:unnamed protein product [Lepeophtheirus salmonis]CAF3020617.1 unnamed protein product [Lepeophtheirus salmonis]
MWDDECISDTFRDKEKHWQYKKEWTRVFTVNIPQNLIHRCQMPIRKIQNTVKTAYHFVQFAKKFTMDKGILADVNPKWGSRIDEHVAQDVINLNQSEDVSRIMPGQKDIVCVYKNGAKIKEQKHLILQYNNVKLQSLDDLVIILQCSCPSIECYIRQCGMCGDEIKIKNILSQILEEI